MYTRSQIVELIHSSICESRPFDCLEQGLAQFDIDCAKGLLLECGIIPESLDHDSSEEKLWAKFADILLAKCLGFMGLQAEVLRARGDSADVFGRTAGYTIVGDAKAFRLSRTAKNQKDFKVKALDDWRKENTYACLLAPLFQFPKRSSQIYSQAVAHNVLLLSYMHLRMLLEHYSSQDLEPLWRLPGTLERTGNAIAYWGHVDAAVCSIVGQSIDTLQEFTRLEIERTNAIAEEGILYWKGRITSYSQLSKQDAVRRLIKAEKIEAKIRTIQKSMQELNQP